MARPRFSTAVRTFILLMLVPLAGNVTPSAAQEDPSLVAGTVDLTPFIGAEAEIAAINDLGHVAGTRHWFSTPWVFRWSAATGLDDLDVGFAHDINNRLDVVGEREFFSGRLWTADGRVIPIAIGPAYSVNDAGTVVGLHLTPHAGLHHAFIWAPTDAELRDIESLDTGAPPWSFFGPSSEARHVTDRQLIAGNRNGRAVVWDADFNREDLGPGIAMHVTDAGVAVGGTTRDIASSQAVVWHDGVMTVLPFGAGPSMATSVNAAGYVVGWMTDGSVRRGFVWHELRGYALLPPGAAWDIDDVGRAVGYVRVDGSRRPTLWRIAMTVDERLGALRIVADRLFREVPRRGQVLVVMNALRSAEQAALAGRLEAARRHLARAMHHLKLLERHQTLSAAAAALRHEGLDLLNAL